MLWYAIAVTVVVGTLLLALASLRRARGAAMALSPWPWRLTLASTLHCTLAFNLTFFVQELFLVLPKALTPGLRPTLFHNNHGWEGEHALASLFQGTGALATLLLGLACALLLRRDVARGAGMRLFLFWMAWCGLFMALPQVVIGAMSERSDVGMALAFFELGSAVKTLLALAALAAIALLALWLTPPLLGLANEADAASVRGRTRFVFLAATLPALLAIALIVPFRIPRETIEVVLLPVLVMLPGLAWMLAGAWRVSPTGTPSRGHASVAWPLLAALALLLVFHAVLRPGIAFF